MLTIYDYLVIGFYLVFMLLIGVVFRKMNNNSSDYFRGGGNMLWWMTGVSAVAAGLTAYTFTAAAAKVSETGFFLLVVYLTGICNPIIVYFFFAARYRQMRVITSAEAIRRRYGNSTEQFWVWTGLPLGLFSGGMAVYIVSLFVSNALQFDIFWCIIILSATVTIMAGTGGSWAIVASDFLQILVILTVSITVFVRALGLPQIGGITGFMDKLPSKFINFSEFERPAVWVAMLVMFTVTGLLRSADINNGASRYLSVKDGSQAKKAVIVGMVGTILIPLLAFLPVMVGVILQLDFAAMFPKQATPGENAYLAIASVVLPQGMMGMLVCAIFAATMSSMDTALNKNSGFFVRNFYIRYINKTASEKQQLKMGVIFTGVFGLLVTLIALLINQFRGADLFSMLLKLNVLLDYPMIIPMMMGMLWKKTPGWSAWSSVLVGMLTAYLAQTYITADMVASWFNMQQPVNPLEISDLGFISSGVITLVVSFLWYFGTTFFYKDTTPEYKDSVDSFFKDMATPIDHVKEDIINQDSMQYRTMGFLCSAYGLILMLGFVIPNKIMDRFVFIWCGGLFLVIGLVLFAFYLKKKKEEGQ